MSSVTVKPGSPAILSCDIYGYPAADITWSFIPCKSAAFDSASCDASGNKITFTVRSQFIDLVKKNFFFVIRVPQLH